MLDEISSDIRERLDMPFLYLFNGEDLEDRITKITIEYNRITKYDKTNGVNDSDYDYITWDYSEKLTIDREVEFASKTSKFIITMAFINGFLTSEDASVVDRCRQSENRIAACDRIEKTIKTKQGENDSLIAKLK